MTTARQFYEQHPDLAVVPPSKNWPTMYDLPSEDPEEPGLPDEFHDLQPQLLSATLRLADVAKDQIFTGTDLNLYYDRDHSTWYKRPDWFLAKGVPRLYGGQDLRLSYVVWDERVAPSVVVELISPGTAMSDLGEIRQEQNGTPTKWQVYEEILQVPYYVVFDRYQDQLWVFKLIEGQYQPQDVRDFRYWLSDLRIGIGIWQGEFQGITRLWLRWFDSEGWTPTDTERADHRANEADKQAEIERQHREAAEQELRLEKQRSEHMAQRLRELGLDPENL